MNTIQSRLKKQLKTASVEHKFESDWFMWVEYPDQNRMSLESPSEWYEYFKEAKEFAENDWGNYKDIIVEAAQKEIPTIIDLKFELAPEYAITTATYSEEPTEEILKVTKDYIESQFADGFGESLEQQKFTSFDWDVEDEYEDEETGEYITEYHTDLGHLFIKLWNASNWSIE